MYAVYIEKDSSLIWHLEAEIQQVEDLEMKAEYSYLLARLYYAAKNKKAAALALEKAASYTKSEIKRNNVLKVKNNLHLLG